MKRSMFWILLGFALMTLPLSGCYTRLGFPGGDPYDSGYDDYSGSGDWIDSYYFNAPSCWGWGHSYVPVWWYADYHQPHWHDGHHYDSDYESYDQASGRHGWNRGIGARPIPRTPTGGVVGGGGGGGVVTVEEPAPTTQSRNPARSEDSKPTPKASEKKSPKKEKSKDQKRRSWGR